MNYWHAMETHVPKDVAYLGVCNVSFQTLQEIYERSAVKPVIVQNDFRASHGYDHDLLEWCARHEIIYQAYAVLKGNVALLTCPLTGWLAEREKVTEPQALYSLLLSCFDGTLCILNGTTNKERMKTDLEAIDRIGKLDEVIIDGFRDELKGVEKVAWPSDKSG